MKTAISSEADEKNSMSNGGPDRVARRRSPTERRGWPTIPNGRAGQTDIRTGAQRKVDRYPTEGTWVPDRDREWPNGGCDGCPTEGSGGGPNGGV
jgi:hypothetical protein